MDVAALSVACLGLVVAALSLGWQIASWALEGPRVRTTLKVGVSGRGGVMSAAVTAAGLPAGIAQIRQEGFDGEALIGVAVTNHGRVRVKVARWGIQMVRGGFSLEQPQSNMISSPLPEWLDPGDSGSWWMPIHEARALVYASRSLDPTAAGVKGWVELGDGTKRSSRHQLDVPAFDPQERTG